MLVGTAVATGATTTTLAQWAPNPIYPDPAFKALDQSFLKYRPTVVGVERLATGMTWSEVPVWFGDGRYLVWSDIPNNRMMRGDEATGAVGVFRTPSNQSNGNMRDRQGRLISCEHGTRRELSELPEGVPGAPRLLQFFEPPPHRNSQIHKGVFEGNCDLHHSFEGKFIGILIQSKHGGST
jgi:hypothetical protein